MRRHDIRLSQRSLTYNQAFWARLRVLKTPRFSLLDFCLGMVYYYPVLDLSLRSSTQFVIF